MEKISKSTMALGLACHMCLLLPATAHAQLTSPREAAQIELGPISLYPSLQVVDAGRDQNVFNEVGTPKPDYTFTLASRALVVARLGLNELMFSSGSDYVWFKKYASERSSNATYALRFNLSASRFKPFIGATRMRTRARPNKEIDVRAHRLERSVTAGSNFSLGARTALTLFGEFDSTSYEDGERFRGVLLDDTLSRSGRRYSGGLRYAVTPLTTLTVTGNYGEDSFSQSHLRDNRRFSVTPLIEFSPDAAIRGQISAGYEVFMPADTQLSDNKGVIVNGALNWSTPSYTTFDLQVTREVSYSYQDSQPYYLQTGVGATITQRLFWTVEVIAAGNREALSYRWRRGVIPDPDAPPRGDTTDTISVGVGIPLSRGFKLVLGVERSRRNSKEEPEANYNRRRLISTVTVGH